MGFFDMCGGILFALLVIIAYLIVSLELMKLFYNSKFYKNLEKQTKEALKELAELERKVAEHGKE